MPQIIWILKTNSTDDFAIDSGGEGWDEFHAPISKYAGSVYGADRKRETIYLIATWTGNGVSWYSRYNGASTPGLQQLNCLGQTYCYRALGV